MSPTEGGDSGSLTSKISNLYFLPRSASWIEEMEKRSRRRTRDLVTRVANQGLSENEIWCARISMMAKSMNALFTGRIQKRKTNTLRRSHLTCNTRPVHTYGSQPDMTRSNHDVRYSPKSGQRPHGIYEYTP